ncbi:MAG: hypothetical protein UIC63_04350 [Bacteroidaceae bacterium]|nr:hypothetical protein [Bacteroidaceae bacterium]
MSKGNMLLGHARGKVGSLVFSRNNGKQIVRSRAEVVKNPQTEKQMVQRIILNTIAQAYSRMSPITDHSFEGIQTGQSSMSFFMHRNMDSLRQKVANEIQAGGDFWNVTAFVPVGSNEFAVNDFVIAKGTLPEVKTIMQGIASTKAAVALTTNTYQGVLDEFGLNRGDQLTFVCTQGSRPDNTQFYFVRVILDPQNADGSQADLSSPFITEGAINLPNKRNEGLFGSLEYADGKILYGFNTQLLTSSAVIVSREKSDGTWARSNATLLTSDDRLAGFFKSLGECLEMLQSGGVNTLSSRYLNNAGVGRLAEVGSGAGITFTTAGGEAIRVIGIQQVGDYYKLVADNGLTYYVAWSSMQSSGFGKVAAGVNATVNAPADITNAEKVNVCYDVNNHITWDDAMVNYLMSLGWTMNYIVNPT